MANQLHEWHDCYLLIGAASGTLIGYLAMVTLGIVLPTRPTLDLDLLAVILVVLLLLGIRNASDITLWIVLNSPGQ